MATACLFIGWNRPSPGSESDAYKYLMSEARERLAAFKKQGYYESHELIGLTPHSGALNGFILLKGERAKLDELRRTDDFEKFSMRLNRLFVGYGVMPGVTEEGIDKVAQRNPELFK